ncbi:MAG: hypothetical protein AB2385_06705 [Symbiobacterium sp.]|uniref:hypothetical protein n=1 Tax=Symbiobacterium sp. TaxID=1971213 RepID=UPI0034643CA8
METLQFLVLVQLVAVLYLIYRVHRLEQALSARERLSRSSGRGTRRGKVVPLLKEDIPPGPFRRSPDPPPSRDEE